jgi:acid phosphatase
VLKKRRLTAVTSAAVLGCATVVSIASTPAGARVADHGLRAINHIVVIYDENHSFDNLYGGWEGVNGLSRAKAANVVQVGQNGAALAVLPQNDVNLPRTTPNAPFKIDKYIPASATTCPTPLQFIPTGIPDGQGRPGGCTRDIVHRYYQEQYQLNGGKQNRYTAGSDAVGLTQGHYDTRSLPIYKYLHTSTSPNYAIADNLFQGAFGGSFLNHQWLVAARTPTYPHATRDLGLVKGALVSASGNDLHSVVDSNGFPNDSYPLYKPTGAVRDSALTQAADRNGKCVRPAGAATPKRGTVCGNYAVNTIQPWSQPYAPGTAAAKRLPPQTKDTIGDRLSGNNLDWAWYAGGWDNAAGNVHGAGWTMGDGARGTCNNKRHAGGVNEANTGDVYPYCATADFQFHHQPFNYYKNFQQGQPGRKHLQDEVNFMTAARTGTLKRVSFVKPLGRENEHPGYASEHNGSDHLVHLIEAVENGPQAKDTLIVVTYDEFGGQWDHVAPPAAGQKGAVADTWGPGTRVPALLISPKLDKRFQVDSTSHDTTSIMATIERRFGLRPLTSRDAKVADFSAVLAK